MSTKPMMQSSAWDVTTDACERGWSLVLRSDFTRMLDR
jgi:hypothetical protein